MGMRVKAWGQLTPRRQQGGECVAVGSREDSLTVQGGRKEQFLGKVTGLF